MALITIEIDTSQRERARGAQWKLQQVNEHRDSQIPPLPPLTMQEFLADQVGRLADGWADEQLAAQVSQTLKDKFLRASQSRRQEIIDLLNSPE